MNENFKNVCEKILNEAVIKIGNMPEYEKCSIIDIEKGLAEVLKNYIELEAKNMSLECNKDVYDLNNNIKIFTNYEHKKSESKYDNENKYICALINNSCLTTQKYFRETIKINYLLNEHDFLSLRDEEIKNSCDHVFRDDDKLCSYFTTNSPQYATLFKEHEVKNICEFMFNKEEYKSLYTLIKIDLNICSIASILHKPYLLYHYNNGTINKVEEMLFYLKDTISDIDFGVFYDKLEEDGSYKVTNIKEEAKQMSFNTAMSLLIALRKLEPDKDWQIEKL